MANIREEEIAIADQHQPPLVNELDQQQEVRDPNIDEGFKLSPFIYRLFSWVSILMVFSTNILAAITYDEANLQNHCKTWEDWNYYMFTALVTFVFICGYYDHFLLTFFLKKDLTKVTSSYLVKLTFVAPVIVFLILSDYFDARFRCKEKDNLAFLSLEVLTATSMIIVVIICLFFLSTLYRLWYDYKNGKLSDYLCKRKLHPLFKACLEEVKSSKGIDKFKKLALTKELDDPENIEIRHLVWTYSLVWLSRTFEPKDMKKHSQSQCPICSTGFTAFQQFVPAEFDKELVVCHPKCLYTKLQADSCCLMAPSRLSSLLADIAKTGGKFDLSLLKTV